MELQTPKLGLIIWPLIFVAVFLFAALFIMVSQKEKDEQKWVWLAVILLVPLFGPLAYFFRQAIRNQRGK
jgi:hypothetical protein